MGVDRKQKEGREEPRRSFVQRMESSWPGEEKENLQKTAQLREGERRAASGGALLLP